MKKGCSSKKLDTSHRILRSFISVAGSLYILNLIDALFFPGKRIRSLYSAVPSDLDDSSPTNGLKLAILPVIARSAEGQETGVHISLHTSF